MKSHQFSVCLYCGSRNGDDPRFISEARGLGRLLAQNDMRLVYGAGDVGIMGETARAVQQAGGAITGVIPQHLVDLEVGKSDLDSYIVTETMHERKKLMFDNADAVIALPGGPGTLDELIEVLTWRQLSMHDKPILVMNVAGYWEPLVTLLDHVIAHGFADASLRDLFEVVPDAEAAVAVLNRHASGAA